MPYAHLCFVLRDMDSSCSACGGGRCYQLRFGGKTESSAMSAPACLMCYSIRGEEIAETKGETFLVLADLRNASCGALPLWNRRSYLW